MTTSADLVGLADCPLCGGEAFMETVAAHQHTIARFMPDYPGGAIAQCLKCSLAIMREGPDAVSEVTAAWNTRAELRALAGAEEILRNPEPIAERIGDMGEGTKLQLFREDDGDFIVSVMPEKHRIPDLQVQFCVPGSGGGSSRKTWDALCALHYAMHEDAAVAASQNPPPPGSGRGGVEYPSPSTPRPKD